MDPLQRAVHLVGVLRARAGERPDHPIYTFLRDGEGDAEELTLAGLDVRARAVGAELQRLGIGGEPVLLLVPSGLDFAAAFFGCLYAGAIAVPAYPPRPNRPDPRLQAIARDARPRAVLTTAALLPRLAASAQSMEELREARWIAVDTLDGGLAEAWREPTLDSSSLAFLQYTSGSTSNPRGVRVSHGNLLANEEAIGRAFAQSEESVVVSWLPLFHDMGLIGGLLQSLWSGGRSVLMTPAAFLQKPLRWLAAISRYRATTSGGPNFAYELCAERIGEAERANLDLAAWSVAFNGAEPVHAGTLARFAAAFAPCGFRRQAFLPCYGLAEATLFVASGRLTEPPVVVRVEAAALERSRAVECTDPGVPGRELVGCGAAAEAHQVSVVDLGSLRPSPPGRVGEIWVAGPSVAAGYWHRPAEQADPFGARLAGGEARFLRTGDLGFQLGGELFITGRIKDLIILRGRNHYPQDLERTAERAHPAVRAGCGAAFPVESRGEERLVIVCELERTAGREAANALDAIRRAVAEEHEVQVHDVVLVRTGTVPKTSSGKIRRHACRGLYLTEGLVVVARSAFAAEAAARDVVPEPAAAPGRTALAILPLAERCAALETYLRSRAARALRRPVAAVDPAQPLAALGLDSLAAIELQHAVETDLGVELDLEELFAEANVAGLAAGLAQAMEREATPARIPPLAGEEEAEIPLSHGQEGLWFQSRLAPESAAHQVVAAARVPGLDSAALRRAFEALVDRHAVLRSTFVERAGEPVQRIAAWTEVAFQIEDAHGWTDQEVEARLAREAWRPFDLENGPPLRIAVFERSGGPSDERPDGEGVLVLALHHLVCDFWSLAVLARELGELYRQETGGAGADLPPLAATWGGWVRRQRQLLAGPEGERLWGFWRQRLAGELPDLEFLTDRPRNEPGDLEGRAGTVTLRVGEAEAAALRALARGRRATLNMALLALFEVVLHRWTGQEDLLIGSPAAGRSAPELAPLVGYFANPVVLRADLSGDPSLVEILDRARGTALAALAHQGFPFPVLVERLRPSRDPGRPPLVQAVLALQRAHLASQEGLAAFALGLPGSRMELGGLVLEPLALARPSTEFELTLLCADLDGGLAFTLEHRAALFDSATMARLLGHLGALLAAVDRPEVPAAGLPILTVAEREQLAAWNRTTTAEPVPGACIHELVAAQAARQPSALAIADGERRLSYGELDGWANRIARALRAKGVGPEAVVAICLERSPELVAGALAVLKAGGAYLPLDPAQPPERLAFFLADAGARWVLTRESLAPCLTGAAAERLLLDREGFESESAGSLAAGVLPGNLAYLIYTSGSTGVPKGTELSHAGLANLVAWHRRAYAPGPDDRAALVAGVGFDASVWEMWPYLAAGASLWVPPEETVLEPAGLLRWLAAGAITHAFLPTPLAELVLGEPPLAGLALRWLLTGGDRLHRRPAPGSPYTLVNHYGPTESTVVTSAGEVPPAGEEHRPPAIGWPIDHLRVWLLDAAFGPVPVGVAGELCVGGVGLARGYLRRPEMTAEKFVPDPMATAEGERLYRTGDLARRLPDGSLEFLGRVDQQVKVRGFRIELGEIEATLLRQPGVRAAAVLALGQRLVGYVVAEGEEPRTADLRRELGLWLPEPMVPAAFVVLPALPLTPSGKVDRLALAQIEPERETATALETPRTPVEDLLVGIFQQVLEIEAVGIQDGFFGLGGHSLLATRVVSRVRQTFGVELPLRELFEAPTVAGLGERIATALRAGGEPAPPLLAGSLDGPLPLSYAQERLWFLDRLEPGSAAYNMPAAFRLEDLLAEEALERAFTEIVRRHAVLRTRFVEIDGRPAQLIEPEPSFGLWRVDLQALPGERRERELARLAREEAARPFDLARGPLLRVGLVRVGEKDHGLLVTLHHIASDGWSVGVLAREVADLYGASEHSSLPELPVQYADYARWQRQWLQGEVLEERLAWWRQRLAGAPALLELPADFPRSTAQGFRAGIERVDLPASLVARLDELGRRHGATRFMALLAGFQALLGRLSGQTDVVVGSPVAGRERIEVEGLIGLFVNTLALRTDLAGSPGFAELLSRVREVTLGAYSHQELPFEKLVEELAPERSLTSTPLVQVMLVLQETRMGLGLPGLRSTALEAWAGTAKLDLTLSLEASEGGLAGLLEYRRDLFDRTTMARLAEHLRRLFEEVAEDPGLPVEELSLLSAAEQQQLLEWNATGTQWPAGRCLHELVTEQVERSPDAVAVIFESESLTYRQLERRAVRLSRQLRRLGVGPDVRVGVCAERSLELMVGLLGVLAAGGAYVPLDPELPAERLAFLVEDSRVPIVLTQAHLADHLPASLGAAKVVLLDEPDEDGEGDLRDWTVPDEALAYVIYTSGSTGRPKGAMNSHRGIVNRLLWMQREYRLGPEDVVLQKTPMSFDVSVWELFWPLLAGAKLVLARPGGHRDSRYLAELIAEQGVTTAHFVPSLLGAFLDDPAAAGCSSLRRVIASGEALSSELVRRFEASGLRARLHNLYGPTEAAVDVTFWACGSEGSGVPIGRPVANTQVHVLDAGMRPVPLGVAGELFLGGVQVGRGYLGKPELTAERFVPDPCSAGPGARLYRTGDLGRHRVDGAVEYLGRLDHQVKIRGVRIELGEIEAALLREPRVREAAVLAVSDRLIAYVAGPGELPSATELRRELGRWLPEAMVPSAFAALPSLPLTPSGKVDRLALGRIEPERETAVSSEMPRTPVEDLLVGIFRQVLEVEAVGIHDGFFDLGGHSLLVNRVVSRVRQTFGVELALRELFEAPTVAGLAERIVAALRAGGEPAPPLLAGSLDGPLPLSYAQERLWFLDRLEPGGAAYNMPAAFRLEGLLAEEALERAFTEIVRRHAVLRTRFVEVDGRPAQMIEPEPSFRLFRADLRALPVERREWELARLAREAAALQFDLAYGSLLRADLVKLGEREHALLVSMHHIASDGWSIGVLVHEVTAFYHAFSTGSASPLPEPPVQYADYARWQRGWLQGEVLQRQLAWWRQRLEGAPPLLDLPLDRPRQAGGGRPAGVERGALPGKLVLALRDFGRRRGATLFMVLLAGFQALLSRLSGQDDVVVGSPVANRNRRETEDLIGFFVNTLALRADLAGAPGFASLLDRARESALGAYSHQDLPFERLVEELRPERSRAHSPLFQVVLALQNAPPEERELPELRLTPLEVPPGRAKFDLTLVLAEESEGLSAWLEHDRRILDGASVRRLFGHFEALLAGAVADPACPLPELPLLGSADRHQLVAEWAVAPTARRTGKGLAELFADQSMRSPGVIALEIETEKGMERLTYGELNGRANRLAWYLRSLGVGSATRVGVGMQRSADLVVALLGVLKAGGAYVPLNPGDPEERLALFLADAGVPLVLVREESRERLRQAAALCSPAAVRVLCLDEEAFALAEWSAADPAPIARAGHPAYAIYTSGSTGLPKGVLVSQEAVARLVLGTDYVELGPTQRMAHVSNPAFDAATFEIWGALLHGACLVGLPRDAVLTPAALAGQLRERRIDVMFLTTALFNQVAGQVPDAFATLDTLLFGGEAVDPAAVRRVLEGGAPRRLLHVYGPTECTTFSAWQNVREVLPAAATVPIGRPVADTALHVVDLAFRPVPVGVVGELLVGGARLAFGYLERPDLTAERFIPDPWSGEVGRRLYRTGDLVRWSPQGAIEFVGRRDHQVKIRGFRIEPGEIEAALASHPEVREAVVVVDEAGAGGRRLIAYVVTAPRLDGELTPRELRNFVAAKLPAYMIPVLFIPMTSLPLNANGKVDRRALPSPERVRPELASAFLAPRTPLERDLAEIWTAALDCGEVGIHDNFFELGGHSLLATHLLASYQESFGVTLPLSLLFESPTVSGLAEAIEMARRPMAEAQETRKSPETPPAIRRIARESHRIKLS